VDKKLVRLRNERLGLLETIRSFAIEKLDDRALADTVRERHAAYYQALAEEARALRGDDEKASLDRLELEHDNLRAALDWLRTHAPARFVHLCGLLGWFFHLHSHFLEGRGYLVDALALARARNEERARVLSALGELAAWSGDLATARAAIEE